MNPTDPRHPWTRLVSAARTVSDDRDTAAPYGFATRVTALAFTQERLVASLFERFSLRAVGVAALLALVSVAANYKTLTSAMDDDEALLLDDPVAELVDVAS